MPLRRAQTENEALLPYFVHTAVFRSCLSERTGVKLAWAISLLSKRTSVTRLSQGC